jgi:hypothetical protein
MAQPAAVWTELVPDDKSFAVLLPGTPKKQTKEVKTPQGTLTITTWVLEPEKDGPAYLVSYSELPGGPHKLTAEQRLDQARDGAVASTKGKIQSEKKMTLQGHPGRDLLILTKDKQHLHTRLFVVGARLYQLFVVGTAAQVASKDTAKFFDSFKLKLP